MTKIPSKLPDLLNLNIHRDLVFIEQRGAGGPNPLNCPAFPGLTDKPRCAPVSGPR